MLRGDGIPSAPSLIMQELLRKATPITALHPAEQPFLNLYLILEPLRAGYLKKSVMRQSWIILITPVPCT